MFVLFAIIAGGLCILASVNDWDWFFENYRARPFVKLFGRDGARKFYIGLGIFIIVMGVLASVH